MAGTNRELIGSAGMNRGQVFTCVLEQISKTDEPGKLGTLGEIGGLEKWIADF